MSLLTAPFDFVGRRADDLVGLLVPTGLVDRFRDRWVGRGIGRAPVVDGPDPRAVPQRCDVRPDDRADRARSEAAAYLSRRRSQLRRDLDARR